MEHRFCRALLGEAGELQKQKQGKIRAGRVDSGHWRVCQPQSSKEEARRFVEAERLKAFAALAPLVPAPRQCKKPLTASTGPAAWQRMAAWQMGFALAFAAKSAWTLSLAALEDKQETVRRGAIATLDRAVAWGPTSSVG